MPPPLPPALMSEGWDPWLLLDDLTWVIHCHIVIVSDLSKIESQKSTVQITTLSKLSVISCRFHVQVSEFLQIHAVQLDAHDFSSFPRLRIDKIIASSAVASMIQLNRTGESVYDDRLDM